jgi:hypothetical protein
MIRRTAGLIALSATVALAGCGAQPAANDTSPGGTSSSDAPPSAAAGAPVPINKTAWFAGLKLAFDSAAYTPAATGGGRITVIATVENNTPNTINLGNLTASYTVDGQSYRGGFATDTMLAGGNTGKQTMTFETTAAVKDPRSGVVSLGSGDQAQAVVPVGDGTLVDLQPKQALAAPKTLPLTGLSYTVSACDVRGDFPAGQKQAHKGKRLVVCAITVQNTYRTYIYIGSTQFAIKPPEGAAFTTTYEDFTREEVPAGAKTDVSVAWEVTWPVAGNYALALSWLGQQGTDKPTAQNTGLVPLTLQ